MRKFALATATAITLIAAATSAAEARHHRASPRITAHHHYSYGHYLAVRHWRYAHRTHLRRHYSAHVTGLPGPCRVAASMGGPCGCWADHVLGVSGALAHVWKGVNLWLADDWRRFPHVSPEQANAAVWPGRHVAPIIPGTYHDGTVVVRDSWKTHRIRVAGLVLVRAPTRADIRGPLYRYTGAAPL